MIVRYSLILISLFMLTACTEEREVPDEPLMMFAAASTTDAVQEIIHEFQEETNEEVNINFAATSVLVRQIENGANAHVFLSANKKWSEYLGERAFIMEQTDLLANDLVIVVPSDSVFAVDQPNDLDSIDIEKIAIGDPEGVPAGIYAKEALVSLNLWEILQPKLIYAPDVRRALMFVENKEADAGFVYETDAKISDQVKIAHTIDSNLHNTIRYPLMLLNEAEDNEAAEQLYEFMQSETAQTIFEKYGFTYIP